MDDGRDERLAPRPNHLFLEANLGLVPMTVITGRLRQRALSAAAVVLLACLASQSIAHASESASCRDLERRFDLIKADVTPDQLQSALFSGAELGCPGLVQALLTAGTSLEGRDALGATPLAHAALAGQRAMVEFLLAEGAQIDSRDVSGATALFLAVYGERHATVALLLAKGANPNLSGPSEGAPLLAAARNGNGRIVEDLLSRGADPNAVDAGGRAAMTYAAARGFMDVVLQLLDAGVGANVRYGHALTALMWCAGYEIGVGVRPAQSVVDLLLNRGAQLDATDDRGRTALMMAAALGHTEIVKMLIGRGADPSVRDINGKVALDLAVNTDIRRTLMP
jgi:uncharacterized protein